MIIDILIVITIIVSILIGKYRGFMKCLIGIASIALSIILALLFYRILGNFIINNTEIDDKIKNTIVSKFSIEDININTNEQLPTALKEYVEKANDGINETKNGIQNNVAYNLATEIIYVISYILIFLLIKIVTIILTIISKIVDKLPVFKEINDIGGAICGLIQGIIIVYIVISLISVISPMIKGSGITNQISNSHIAKFIYDNNLFL